MADFMKHDTVDNTKKTKKYGTRKTPDGIQVWSSQEFRNAKDKAKWVPKGNLKAVRKIGQASADAFWLQGLYKETAKVQAKAAAKKRIGKPAGGK